MCLLVAFVALFSMAFFYFLHKWLGDDTSEVYEPQPSSNGSDRTTALDNVGRFCATIFFGIYSLPYIGLSLRLDYDRHIRGNAVGGYEQPLPLYGAEAMGVLDGNAARSSSFPNVKFGSAKHHAILRVLNSRLKPLPSFKKSLYHTTRLSIFVSAVFTRIFVLATGHFLKTHINPRLGAAFSDMMANDIFFTIIYWFVYVTMMLAAFFARAWLSGQFRDLWTYEENWKIVSSGSEGGISKDSGNGAVDSLLNPLSFAFRISEDKTIGGAWDNGSGSN